MGSGLGFSCKYRIRIPNPINIVSSLQFHSIPHCDPFFLLTAMSQRLRMDDDYTPINDLPDTYLHQILSFVSIKDVAIITMLSKRWYSVFLSQPILNLDDSHFRDPSTVRKFFESMIAARDNYHPPIRIPLSHSTSNVTTKFVSAALNRGLQISLLWF